MKEIQSSYHLKQATFAPKSSGSWITSRKNYNKAHTNLAQVFDNNSVEKRIKEEKKKTKKM